MGGIDETCSASQGLRCRDDKWSAMVTVDKFLARALRWVREERTSPDWA